MSALSINPPFPVFPDTDGQPLEDGYIWIGVAGLNPLTNPIVVYWDAALTLPAGQPVRTINGFPSRAGTPARLYADSDYSIQVQNKNGSLVYSSANATELLSSDLVTFIQAGTGAVQRTAQSKMRDIVNVLDFGADPTGVSDSTTSFISALAAHDYVVWPEGLYKINETITIGNNKTVSSENAHLNYTNAIDDQACVVMDSNSQLIGSVSITMPDGALGVNVNHLRVGGGMVYSDGATNVKIGKITVYGGHATMAAVLVEGASENIYIEEVSCPGVNTKIGQVFGCHWGNFADHYLSGGSYVNVPGGAPTTHPKNVRLDRLIVGTLTNSDGIENCAAFISSSRDVKIGYISVNEASYAAVIYPGDISFEYADAATKEQKMYGIEIDTIIGKTRRGGLYITGSAPYSTESGEVEFRSEYVNLQPTTTTGNAYPGISMNKVIGVIIDDCRLKYYDQGIALGILSRNVRINTPRIESVDKQGIVIAGALGNECSNVVIISPYVSNCNRDTSADPAIGSAISISRAQGVTVVGGILGTTNVDTQYAAFNATSTVVGATVENVKTYGSVSGVGFYANSTSTDQVSFINCSCASGMTLRSGGVATFVLDQRKVVYGLEAPTSGTWEAGDLVLNRDTSVAGLAYGWQCISSGTPGTWKVVGQRGVRLAITNTPEYEGQVAIVAADAYMAVGTSSSADWKKITP